MIPGQGKLASQPTPTGTLNIRNWKNPDNKHILKQVRQIVT
jgi:hypothetical protein